jgi:hypothetical protein
MLSAMAPQGQLRADEYNAITQRQSAAMRNQVAQQRLEADRRNRARNRQVERDRLAMMADKYRDEEGWREKQFEFGRERAVAADERATLEAEALADDRERTFQLRKRADDRRQAADDREKRKAEAKEAYQQGMVEDPWRSGAMSVDVYEAPPLTGALGEVAELYAPPREQGYTPVMTRRERDEEIALRKQLAALEDMKTRRRTSELGLQEATIRLNQLQGSIREQKAARIAREQYMKTLPPSVASQLGHINNLKDNIGIEEFRMLPQETQEAWLVWAGLKNPDQEWPDEVIGKEKKMAEAVESPKYREIMGILAGEFASIDRGIREAGGKVTGEDLEAISAKLKQYVGSMAKEMSIAGQAAFLKGLDKDGTQQTLMDLFPKAYEIYMQEAQPQQESKIRAHILKEFGIRADTISAPGFWTDFLSWAARLHNEVVVQPVLSVYKRMHPSQWQYLDALQKSYSDKVESWGKPTIKPGDRGGETLSDPTYREFSPRQGFEEALRDQINRKGR